MKQSLKQDATFWEYLWHDNKTYVVLVPLWMLGIFYMLASYDSADGFGGPGFTYAAAIFSALIWLGIFYKLAEGFGDHIRGRSR